MTPRASTLVIPPFLAYDQAMTRPALILVAALALTGCADVAANVALNVVGPVLIEPAIQLVALTAQAAGEGITAGVEYTAEQLEALHKFLGDEGFYELFGGPASEEGVK
jgi:hypothetical protein